MHWWRSKFSGKKTRKSLPAHSTLHSVPEDSLATPSKPHDAALSRVTDLDSAEGSPKINAGRLASFTQSSAQLSSLMKPNELSDPAMGLQTQDVSAQLDRTGGQQCPFDTHHGLTCQVVACTDVQWRM